MKVPVLIPRIFDHPHTYLSGKLEKLKPGGSGFGSRYGYSDQNNQGSDPKPGLSGDILFSKSSSLNITFIFVVNCDSIFKLCPWHHQNIRKRTSINVKIKFPYRFCVFNIIA